MANKIYYSNNDLEKGIHKISRQMVLDNWKPDLVVGILRGGSIPAVYLSHWFKCEMSTMPWSTRDNAVDKAVCDKMLNYLIDGKNVVLVDDICDSGLTLSEIYQTLEENLKNNELNLNDVHLKTACLHFNIVGNFGPDYFDQEINKDEDPSWIIYPWENS